MLQQQQQEHEKVQPAFDRCIHIAVIRYRLHLYIREQTAFCEQRLFRILVVFVVSVMFLML